MLKAILAQQGKESFPIHNFDCLIFFNNSSYETYIIYENYSWFRQLHGKNSKAVYLTDIHLPGLWRIGNFFKIYLDCVPTFIQHIRFVKSVAIQLRSFGVGEEIF